MCFKWKNALNIFDRSKNAGKFLKEWIKPRNFFSETLSSREINLKCEEIPVKFLTVFFFENLSTLRIFFHHFQTFQDFFFLLTFPHFNTFSAIFNLLELPLQIPTLEDFCANFKVPRIFSTCRSFKFLFFFKWPKCIFFFFTSDYVSTLHRFWGVFEILGWGGLRLPEDLPFPANGKLSNIWWCFEWHIFLSIYCIVSISTVLMTLLQAISPTRRLISIYPKF